jgi:hypothetical protein
MKTVENVTKRKPRRDSIPRLWNAKGMFPGYLVGSHVLFCDVLRVMFAYLRVSCEYKFQLNWILMKQSSVLPTQKPRVIRDIQVESVLNIHVCISMRNRLLYKPPPLPNPYSFYLFCIQTRFHSNFERDTTREMLAMPTPSFRYSVF